MEQPLRILIADDHDAIRRGIRSLLSTRADWSVVAEARDGIEAIEKARAEKPDIVLMDIFMPRLDGLAATRTIRQEQPESEIVIISQTDASIGRSHAEQIGARGYVAKADLARDLLPAIEKVAALQRNERKTNRTVDAQESPQPAADAAPLDSVLCTEELQTRPNRPPDYEAENRALALLAQTLSDSPRAILQTLAETILQTCKADSAGVSLLTTEDGAERLYWPAVVGRWKPHIGGGTARDFGPGGDVLDRNTPLLFRRLDKRYTYLQRVSPAAEEALLAPFHVGGKAVGTVWAVTHNTHRKFDREDERLLVSLARFASSAYQVLTSLDALTREASEREKSDSARRQSDSDLRDFVESALVGLHWVGPDGTILWANRAEMEILGVTREEYIGRHISEFHADQDAIADILSRLVRGETIRDLETRLRHKDGSIRHVLISSSALFENGKFIHSRCFSRDITERKQIEIRLRESEERYHMLADSQENLVRTRTEQLNQRNMEVIRQAELLRELSHRLLQAQDQERRRIARDLHDSAGQLLASLSMTFGIIVQQAPPASAEIVNAANEGQRIVEQLSREIRTVSYLLHPPLLDESGLPAALHWYLEGLQKRGSLDVSLSSPEDFGRLPDETELAIFRIIQECLTNVHRHSGSKTASIRLTRTPGQVALEVEDKGRGMLADKLSEIQTRGSGVGFMGMRERVRHLAGEMNVQSDARGTTLSFKFPLALAETRKTSVAG